MLRPSQKTPASAPRRRGCLGWFLQGGLGCGAFLAGAFGAAFLFAPTLLSGAAGALLEKVIDDAIAGRVTVEGFHLDWLEAQTGEVIVHDAEEGEVARIEVSLPPLFVLFGLRDTPAHIALHARLLRWIPDGRGGSNLLAAFSPKGIRSSRVRIGDFDSADGYDASFSYTLDARVDQLLVEGEAGFELRDLRLNVQHEPKGADEITLLGEVQGSEGVPGTLRMQTRFQGSAIRSSTGKGSSGERSWPWYGAEDVALDIEASGLESALLEWIADVPVGELFGPNFEGRLSVHDDARGRRVSLDLGGKRLEFEGLWEGTQLVGEGRSLRAELPLPAPWLARVVGDLLPASTRLAGLDSAGSWQGVDLHIPVGELGGPWPSADELWEGLSGRLEFKTAAPLNLVAAESGRLLESLPAASLALDLAGAGSKFTLSSEGDGRSLSAELLPAGGGGLLRGDPSREGRVDSTGHGLALLDSLRSPTELGAGLFEASFEPATTELSYRRGGGETRLDLEDGLGSSLGGRIEGGELVSEGESPSRLRLPLDRKPARRLIATLLPWLGELGAPAGAAPAELLLTNFRLPVQGDLSLGRATLRLRLGRVHYVLAEGLCRALGAPDHIGRVVELLFPDIRMVLQRQEIEFKELVIATAADDELDFEGTLQLAPDVAGQIHLDGELPLVRAFRLDPMEGAEETYVPIKLTGDWSAPQKHVDTEAVDSFIELMRALGK